MNVDGEEGAEYSQDFGRESSPVSRHDDHTMAHEADVCVCVCVGVYLSKATLGTPEKNRIAWPLLQMTWLWKIGWLRKLVRIAIHSRYHICRILIPLK